MTEFIPGVTQDSMTTADIIQSMQGHLQDAYTSVQEKSGTIPTRKNLANLAGAIDSISTGTDTSDATATAADILKDKTAYVASGKVTGTIETWAGEFEEISGGGYTGEINIGPQIGGLKSSDVLYHYIKLNADVCTASDYDYKIKTTGQSWTVTVYDKQDTVIGSNSVVLINVKDVYKIAFIGTRVSVGELGSMSSISPVEVSSLTKNIYIRVQGGD